jgi:hypothetical protein
MILNKAMSLVKRDYCLMFAKEDCRRQSAQESSISTVVQNMTTTEGEEFSKVLSQRAPKSGPSGYLRTSDAWLRRASAVRIAVLEAIRNAVIVDTERPVIDVCDLREPAAREIVLTAEEEDPGGDSVPSDAKTQISVALQSTGGARSVVSIAQSDVRRSAPRDARSEVSVARSATRPTNDHQSDRETDVVSITQTTIREREENAVKRWYEQSVSELSKKKTDGELRDEQFNRKKALLRAEYWTKMDKMRNNATPTLINAP